MPKQEKLIYINYSNINQSQPMLPFKSVLCMRDEYDYDFDYDDDLWWFMIICIYTIVCDCAVLYKKKMF